MGLWSFVEETEEVSNGSHRQYKSFDWKVEEEDDEGELLGSMMRIMVNGVDCWVIKVNQVM